MMRVFAIALLVLCSALGVSASTVVADTLQVNVTVEVVLPDSSRVTRTVRSEVPSVPYSRTVIVPEVVVEPVDTVPVNAAAVVAETTAPAEAYVSSAETDSLVTDSVCAQSDSIPTLLPVATPYIKPPVPDPVRVHFAWGAELGSTVDLSAHDMSSIDFNAYFGLRYKWLSLAGVGAGADIMVSNSCRTYPVFGIVRTDFSRFVKLIFLDLRGGVALNYLPANVSQRGAYASVSVGFNLARSAKFRSYVLAGYTYVGRKDVVVNERTAEYSPLSMASIRLGVAF